MALVKYNNNSISSVTAAAALASGAMTLIKSQTASSSATISFVDGTSDVVLDNTYPIYLFKFINLHPATNNAEFNFNMSVDGGSNYNVTKTTTAFVAYNRETGSDNSLAYYDEFHLAQSTGFQSLNHNVGSDNDQAVSGFLYLYAPSDTTFVKHFMARTLSHQGSDYAMDQHVAGYGNNTSAVDAIQFKYSSGNIDSGVIKLYGVS